MNADNLQNNLISCKCHFITTELCKIYPSICRYAPTFCRESYTAK